MAPLKAAPISKDLHYPCPRCRQGQLCPITLTEALGCQKCQKIFVVQPNGYTLEQLSTQPVGPMWRWNGGGWSQIRPPWSGRSILISSFSIAAFSIFFSVVLASKFNLRSEMLWWILVVSVMGILCSGALLFLRSRRF